MKHSSSSSKFFVSHGLLLRLLHAHTSLHSLFVAVIVDNLARAQAAANYNKTSSEMNKEEKVSAVYSSWGNKCLTLENY